MGTMRGIYRSELAETCSNIFPFFTISSFSPAKKDLTPAKETEKSEKKLTFHRDSSGWRATRDSISN